jgi:signal transduction histidine kinase
MAEALEDGMAGDPSAYHRKIIAQTDQMAVMVNDLLELSKIQAGTLRLDAEPLDLYDLASDALADLAPLAAQRNIKLDGGGQRESLALADGPAVGRAIRNIVLNAIMYSRPGSNVTVTVGSGHGSASVTVTDGCGGIPAEDLPHVFETGWRGNPARRTEEGDREGPTRNSGAGVGLSMVAGIAHAHGGGVSVENVDGGCRLTLRLPTDGNDGAAPVESPRSAERPGTHHAA